MKFLSDILARAGLVVDGTVTLNSVANATTDTDRFIVVDSGVVKYRTGSQLLSDIGGISGNQTITLSGDATGSGTTAIAVTLANSGVTAGTYRSVTVDAKGRVTSGTNPTTLAGYGITDAMSYFVGAGTADYNTNTTNGIYRNQGGLNGPSGNTHTTMFSAFQTDSNYGWQLTAYSSDDIFFRFKDTTFGSWNRIATRAWVTSQNYITGNQTITLSGDATGSGTTSIAVTLANSGVTAGTYGSSTAVPVITVDAKGRVTSVTTASISGSLTFTGDVTGSGTTGSTTTLTLANSGVTAGTYNNVTVDAKGRVTSGSNVSYLTSYSETDTLATVTARGSSTTGSITINGYATIAGGADLNLRAASASTDTGDIVFQDGSGNELHRLYQGSGSLSYRTNAGPTYLLWHTGNLTNLNQLTNGPGYITGNQTITLTGNVTGSGTTSITTTIANGVVTNAMLVNSSFNIGTTSISLGRASASQTLTGVSIDGTAAYLQNFYTTSDANSLWQAGVYTFFNGTNVPGGDFGMISIPTWGSTNSSSRYNLQIGSNIGGNPVFRTTNINGAGTWYTFWHSGNLTNLNQLTNGPGYITSYTETDTLATVTARGATTSTGVTFNGSVNTGGVNGIELGWTGSTINDQRIGRIRPISTPSQNPYAGGLAFDYYKYSGTQYQFYEGMRLTGSGSLGIGTASPTHLLSVSRATESAAYQININNDGGISNGNYTGIRFSQSSDASTELGNIRLSYFTNGSTALSLGTRYATQAIYIDNTSDGKVGIGLTSLLYGKLSVSSGNFNGIRIDTNAGYDAISIGGTGALAVDAPGITGGRFYVANGGNVGIANNNPIYKLDISGSLRLTGALVLDDTTSNVIQHRAGTDVNTLVTVGHGGFDHNGYLRIGGANVATQTWVQSQGYITPNSTVSGWIAFQASTQGTTIIRAVQQDSSNGYYLFQGVTGSTEVYRVDRFGNTNLGGSLYLTGTSSNNIYLGQASGTGVNIPAIYSYSANGTYYWSRYVDNTGLLYWVYNATVRMQLGLTGNLTISGTLTENSSLRWKENIQDLSGSLDKVEKLRGVTYNKKGETSTEIGLIAEEVEEVYPEFVEYDEKGQPVGLHYTRLTAVLIESVKELKNRITELENRN